jgi:hypothetical protein
MIKQIHIYDIDGTLVDSTHRYRTILKADGSLAIDFPYWFKNQRLAAGDSLLPLAAQYQAQLADPSIYVIAATARCMVPAETAHIVDVLGWPDHMIQRASGDNRSGALLKVLGLNKLFSLKQFANIKKRFFYEDNKDYLKAVSEAHNCTPIYIESKQGY